jgi:flagellum-specific peptidoglycan hydrolase FlgJ
MTTTGGANLRTFSDSKDSIRGFLQLITSDDRYKNVRESTENIENMFKGMSPYAERTDYPSFLANVYNDRIKPIIETENMLIPKRKPIVNQMNTLK